MSILIKERNKEIAQKRKDGYSLQELGLFFNLTRERIRQILLENKDISDFSTDKQKRT